MIFFLFSIFESFLFPRSILSEEQFNPATLHEKIYEVLVGTETRFGLSELSGHTVYAQLSNYSLCGVSFGSGIYRENMLQFGFAFPLVKDLAIGMHIAALNCWIKDNENDFSYSLKAGGIYCINRLRIGVWVNNFNIPKFGDGNYLPLSYSLRLDYQTMENMDLYFATRGIETDLPFFNFGLFFSPYEVLRIGFGVNTDPILLEYVLSITLGDFVLNYAGSAHRQLGMSHFISFGFRP